MMTMEQINNDAILSSLREENVIVNGIIDGLMVICTTPIGSC